MAKTTSRKAARKGVRKASATKMSGPRSRRSRSARPPAKKISRSSAHRWSAEVTQHSDALDLEEGVFAQTDPKRIAASLKRSAEASTRKKTSPFRSALSMLTFYINRAGTNLSPAQRAVLMRTKDELRKQFGRA